VCLLFCDIDDFKAINRTLGYSEGDRVLRRLSHLIGSCLRKEDLVCRYGGDEFAVLLPSTDHSGAREVAKRILAEIKAQTTRGEFLPSLSIGVVCYPDDANSLEDIMVKADISMHLLRLQTRKIAMFLLIQSSSLRKQPRLQERWVLMKKEREKLKW